MPLSKFKTNADEFVTSTLALQRGSISPADLAGYLPSPEVLHTTEKYLSGDDRNSGELYFSKQKFSMHNTYSCKY